MRLTPLSNIAAAYCSSKRRYETQEEAETAAARHYAYRVCMDGSVTLGAYLCQAGRDHWHTGHMGIGARP